MLEAVSKVQGAFVWRTSYPTELLPPLTCIVVWKRKKGVKYLGSVHGGELSEFYGMSQDATDKVALDSVCEFWLRARGYDDIMRLTAPSPVSFVNFQNPIPPHNHFSGSLLHNATWPKWGTDRDQPPVFLFSDNPRETYGLIKDTYRKPHMELLTQVQVELGV